MGGLHYATYYNGGNLRNPVAPLYPLNYKHWGLFLDNLVHVNVSEACPQGNSVPRRGIVSR